MELALVYFSIGLGIAVFNAIMPAKTTKEHFVLTVILWPAVVALVLYWAIGSSVLKASEALRRTKQSVKGE